MRRLPCMIPGCTAAPMMPREHMAHLHSVHRTMRVAGCSNTVTCSNIPFYCIIDVTPELSFIFSITNLPVTTATPHLLAFACQATCPNFTPKSCSVHLKIENARSLLKTQLCIIPLQMAIEDAVHTHMAFAAAFHSTVALATPEGHLMIHIGVSQ
eukprot:3199969-Pleurochrysis_carterae.AAC.2